MFKKTIAATALAVITAVPALAGSVAPPVIVPAPTAPVAAPSSDWTGFYVGLNGGIVIEGISNYWAAGAHAGYLQDLGDFVVGGEASYNYVSSPVASHILAADAILGYDAGSVMPHITFGGSYVTPANVFGVSAGAGLSVKASDNIILTGRYRYTYAPSVPSSFHQGILAMSFQF
jgi:opacity protein-like surface antigen